MEDASDAQVNTFRQYGVQQGPSTDGYFFSKLSSGGLLGAFKRHHSNAPQAKIAKKSLRMSLDQRRPVCIELRQYDRQAGEFLCTSLRLGRGHDFRTVRLENPTWCDQCGDFLWGFLNRHCVRCQYCNYTCHHKCRQLVTLDCTNPAHEVPVETSLISQLAQQSSTLTSPSTAANNSNGSIQCDTSESGISTCSELSETGVPLPITKEELKSLIETFNKKSQGLQIVLHHDGETFRGFIRVHMELHRPINIVAGNRPASIFDIMAGDTFEKRRTRTSFYIPKDTIKALHITSETTASEVIEALLKKFKVSDNPLKFALYERYTTDRHKIVIRRLSAEERPLWLCLQWGKANARSLVLQENETGEVMWDVFSVPELENFLRILDKEEEEYIQQVQARYALKKRRLQDAMARFECHHLISEEPILV